LECCFLTFFYFALCESGINFYLFICLLIYKDAQETENTTNIEIVNIQVISKPEEESDNIELLDYLLSFLDTDDELNHVLAGYFSKFMLLLLSKQQKNVN
jgi:hypothetical protein